MSGELVDVDVTPLASVVIPAHNEARGISRTLEALQVGLRPAELEVVVVCNGCEDETATVVRRNFPGVRVVEIPEPSKAAAVRAGNAVVETYPRVHLDADVQLTGTSIRALVQPLVAGSALATAPKRILATDGCSLTVRAYYYVWERLPQVREGLFGRGVYALSKEGQSRVSALPQVMSDDLAASEAFDRGERVVVESATVVVIPPRRTHDLIRRRVRVATGNAQASAQGTRTDASITTVSALWTVVRRHPRVALRLPVFIGVTLFARAKARRSIKAGDFTTWLRDESSRG